MKTVTFDSTSKPNDALLSAAASAGWHISFTTVSLREAEGTDFEQLLRERHLSLEVLVFDESRWDESRWGDETSAIQLRAILRIISSGSFPTTWSTLTTGQLHQLRDAMALEAHVSAGRSVFVTADRRAFINNERRDALQQLLSTRILTPEEFCNHLSQAENNA